MSVLPLSPWIQGLRQESFTLACRWYQLLSGSLLNGSLSWVSRRCRLGREIFTLPYVAAHFHGAIGCNQNSFIILVVWQWHQLLSRFLPNGQLSRVSHRLGWELFFLPSYVPKSINSDSKFCHFLYAEWLFTHSLGKADVRPVVGSQVPIFNAFLSPRTIYLNPPTG